MIQGSNEFTGVVSAKKGTEFISKNPSTAAGSYMYAGAGNHNGGAGYMPGVTSGRFGSG
jgi:hypothetical protein